MSNKLKNEINTSSTMIEMYCKKHHSAKDLCEECQDLLEYTTNRLRACRNIENKPVCRKCKTPCFSKEYKEKLGKVMRYSGPRMIIKDPISVIKHILQK